MFVDYPHKIKKIKINNKEFISKKLNDSSMLMKELEIMKFIEPFNISPKVHDYNKAEIIEEFIIGDNLKGYQLNNKLICDLAKRVNRLHEIKLTDKLIRLLKDEFVSDNKYHPLKLYNFIVKDIAQYLDSCKLSDLFIFYESYLSSFDYKMGLVHGDLTPNNIIFNHCGLYFIDWTDCRYDILSCDVAQLFYTLNFNNKQKEIFLNNYNATYIDEILLEMHYLLFLLFDLNYVFRKTGNISQNIFNKINKIIYENKKRSRDKLGEYLYELSKEDIKKNIFLEGGYALNFIYKLPRRFSGDIDFTLSRVEHVDEFIEKSILILNKILNQPTYSRQSNKLIVSQENKHSFDIDYYVVPGKYFEYKKQSLMFRGKKYYFNTHTLKDILCEKISNILQSNRFEFKDVVDINLIYEKKIRVNNFYRLLNTKLEYKFSFVRDMDLLEIVSKNKYKFISSHKKRFSDYDFEKEFETLFINLKK